MENNPAGPIIIQKAFQSQSLDSNKSRKIIMMLIILILIGTGIYFVSSNNLLKNVFRIGSQNASAIVPIGLGTISLTPISPSFNSGDPINIDINLDTGGRTVQGVDLVISYNPKLLEASPKTVFTRGTLYSEYPIVAVDNTQGIIQVSAIASISNFGFNGVGKFGSLQFRTLDKGNATVSVRFAKDNTTDSNLVEFKTGTDILGNVENAEIDVK